MRSKIANKSENECDNHWGCPRLGSHRDLMRKARCMGGIKRAKEWITANTFICMPLNTDEGLSGRCDRAAW